MHEHLLCIPTCNGFEVGKDKICNYSHMKDHIKILYWKLQRKHDNDFGSSNTKKEAGSQFC